MVGDQLLTDICLGNKSGMATVYVDKFADFYHQPRFSSNTFVKWEKELQTKVMYKGIQDHLDHGTV